MLFQQSKIEQQPARYKQCSYLGEIAIRRLYDFRFQPVRRQGQS